MARTGRALPADGAGNKPAAALQHRAADEDRRDHPTRRRSPRPQRGGKSAAGPPCPDSPKEIGYCFGRTRAREDLLRLTGIASLCAVVGCTLLCTTQMSRAQTTDQTGSAPPTAAPRPRPSEPPPAGEAAARRQRQSTSSQWQAGRGQRLARYNLPDPHPGPRIDASLLLPASMKRGPILIDIDVMQVFIPWEFRVAGVLKR